MLFFFPPPLSVKKKRTSCRKTCSLLVEWLKILLQLSREMSAGEKNPDSKEKATSFYHFKKEQLACDWPQTILMLFDHPNIKQRMVFHEVLHYGQHQLGLLSPESEESLLPFMIYLMLWEIGFGPEREERICLSAGRLSQHVMWILFFHAFMTTLLSVKRSEFPIILFLCYQSHGKKMSHWKATGTFFFFFFFFLLIKQSSYRQKKSEKNSRAISFF